MDLRQLETFIEVVKEKSFSKAADKLFITQPTVTNHIQNLEKELATLLLNRQGKCITLTDSGNLLYKYAISIINSIEMARFDLSAFQGKIQGQLDIKSSSVPRKYLLPQLIHSFNNIYPGVTFNISNDDSREVVNKVLKGETDFGIVGTRIDSNNLIYIDIMEDNLVLVTPNNFISRSNINATITWDQLLEEKFIFREEGSGTRHIIVKEFENNSISINQINIVAYVQDSETIKKLITTGVGVSFLSEKDVVDDIKLGHLKCFKVIGADFIRKFYFVYHKNRQLSPLGETFKNHILEYIKDPES